MSANIYDHFRGKRVVIWGLGREGKSTLNFLNALSDEQRPAEVGVLDSDTKLYHTLYDTLSESENFIKFVRLYKVSELEKYDIIIKAPGIVTYNLDLSDEIFSKITSQTDIFLQYFALQTVGITGTKGKSTTTTVIYEVLKQAQKGNTQNVLLAGNIGVPCFDIISQIAQNTVIVYEMSSHQLEFVKFSPHIALILNLYEDHLDHYASLEDYHNAKRNIGKFQGENDYLITDISPEDIANLKEKGLQPKILGEHNFINFAFAYKVCCDILAVPESVFIAVANNFPGLPHRLEFVANIDGIDFYNDSISTIPEATISAVNAVNVHTKVAVLIAGGMDRGIDYSVLIEKLPQIEHTVLFSESGIRIYRSALAQEPALESKLHLAQNLADAVMLAKSLAKDFIKYDAKGKGAVIFSPAAASYNDFKDFAERGEEFKALILRAS